MALERLEVAVTEELGQDFLREQFFICDDEGIALLVPPNDLGEPFVLQRKNVRTYREHLVQGENEFGYAFGLALLALLGLHIL